MQVLDEEDEGLAPTRSNQQIAQRVERARHQRLGLEGGQPFVRRFDAEQVDEVRSAIGGVHAHGLEGGDHPRDHLFGRVGIADTAGRSQKIEDRDVRDRAAI